MATLLEVAAPGDRRPDRLRFKVKGKCRESFRVRVGVKVDPTGVTLPRLGRLRIKGKASRVQGEIRYATVSEQAGRCKPAETLNARGGIVRPGFAWQIPLKREPSTDALVA